MKNCQRIGRYREVSSGKEVNVYTGLDKSEIVKYYLFRGERVIISDADFSGKWVEVLSQKEHR